MNHGKPWPPKDELRDIFERLVLWYTLADIAQLLGRTEAAVSRKMCSVGVPVRLRRNYGGKTARSWTREERLLLFDKCRKMTQTQVAELLGTSRSAVEGKWRREGIRWDQGYYSLADVARVAGCTVQHVSKVAKAVFDGPNKPTAGQGVARRWRMTLGQAEELMRRVRPGRVPYLKEGRQ